MTDMRAALEAFLRPWDSMSDEYLASGAAQVEFGPEAITRVVKGRAALRASELEEARALTDMRERLIAMATFGAYRGSGSPSARAETAERLVTAVERQAVERVLDKARKWHDDGSMTHAEWAAVCAVFYVEEVRPSPEGIERIVAGIQERAEAGA